MGFFIQRDQQHIYIELTNGFCQRIVSRQLIELLLITNHDVFRVFTLARFIEQQHFQNIASDFLWLRAFQPTPMRVDFADDAAFF